MFMLDAHGCLWILVAPLPHPKASQSAQLPWLNSSIKTSKSKPVKYTLPHWLWSLRIGWYAEFCCKSETQLIQHKLTECDHRHLLFVHHGTCMQGLTCTWVMCQEPSFRTRKITLDQDIQDIPAKLASQIYGLARQTSGLLTGTTSLWDAVTPRGMRDELWQRARLGPWTLSKIYCVCHMWCV